MSEQPGAFVDDLFASVMDTLAADEAAETAGAGDTAAVGSADDGGAAAAEDLESAGGAGTGAAAGTPTSVGEPDPNLGDDAPRVGSSAPADAGGDSGAEGSDDGSGDRPGASAGTVDYASVKGDIQGLSTKFEETTLQAFQQQALSTVQEEYKNYFDALRQHPRLLVGTQVPALGPDAGEGEMETLRDAADAKDWQDAVKSLLTEEVRERAEQSMEENKGILDTVHASIELFTKNPDLVPGTRQFNRQLADRFAAMAKPYELRVDGKLHGYTIPVQPLIDQLRTQVSQTPAPAASPPDPAGRRGRPPGSKNKLREDQPQAGIRSKAGSESGEAEDFSTLFGTLGLPNLRI